MAGNVDQIEDYERRIAKLQRDLEYFNRELAQCQNEGLRAILLRQIRDATNELAHVMRLSREAYDTACKNMEKALDVLDKRRRDDGTK